MTRIKSNPLKQPLELEKIYEAFVTHIAPYVRLDMQRGLNTREWNNAVFGFFYKLCKERGSRVETNWRIKEKFDPVGYKSYLEKYRSKPHEYLTDFCAWKQEDDRYWLDFIVEVEWRPERPSEDLDEDFYKMLDVKAYAKIGIGGCSKKGKKLLRRSEVWQLLDKVSQLLQKSPWKAKRGESYLFIFMDSFSEPRAGISGHLLLGNGKIRTELTFYSYKQLAGRK